MTAEAKPRSGAPPGAPLCRIGLAMAEANVEVARSLALISVRELDDYETKRLESLVSAKAPDKATALGESHRVPLRSIQLKPE